MNGPRSCAIYLLLVAVHFPAPAAGQSRSFAVESDVTVRADSFACKETSELDRLLQRNQSGGFTSGTQLYNYLKAHKCLGLTAGRARVYSIRSMFASTIRKTTRLASIPAPGREQRCCLNEMSILILSRLRGLVWRPNLLARFASSPRPTRSPIGTRHRCFRNGLKTTISLCSTT